MNNEYNRYLNTSPCQICTLYHMTYNHKCKKCGIDGHDQKYISDVINNEQSSDGLDYYDNCDDEIFACINSPAIYCNTCKMFYDTLVIGINMYDEKYNHIIHDVDYIFAGKLIDVKRIVLTYELHNEIALYKVKIKDIIAELTKYIVGDINTLIIEYMQ